MKKFGIMNNSTEYTYLEYLQWAHMEDSLQDTLDSEWWREQD